MILTQLEREPPRRAAAHAQPLASSLDPAHDWAEREDFREFKLLPTAAAAPQPELMTILSALLGRLAVALRHALSRSSPGGDAATESVPLASLLNSLIGWLACTMRTTFDQVRESFIASHLTELRPLAIGAAAAAV